MTSNRKSKSNRKSISNRTSKSNRKSTRMSATYELPEDVWSVVMSFFHSSYKKPTHYEAIMATKDFYNKTKFVKRDERKNAPIFVSYYAHIIAKNWVYWSMADLHQQLVRPEVSFTRGVARGKTRDEFAAIWNQYKTNQHYYGGAEVKFSYIV